MMHNRSSCVVLCLVISLLYGCGQAPVAPTAVATTPTATLSALSQMQTAYAIATPTASTTPSPSDTPRPSETPTPRPTLGPALPLDPDGPWLLFTAGSDRVSDARNLWATNADGTHMNKLVDENIVAYAVQPGSSLAGGVLVAYASMTTYDTRDLALKLLHLPDGQIETITPLINDRDGQPPIDTDLARYAVENGGLTWSADGQQLAFVGQINGPSMDVYRYQVATHSIHWLSSGKTQALHLEWSPDQQWIVHQGFTIIGMGGPGIDGMWAARIDGSGSTTLAGYGPSPDGFKGQIDYLGWKDSSHVLLDDYVFDTSDTEETSTLKSVDITNSAVENVLTAHFLQAAYSRPDDTWLLADHYNRDPQKRVRLFHDGKMTNLPSLDLGAVRWSNLHNAFIGSAAHDDILYSISSSGQVAELPIPGTLGQFTFPDIIPSPDNTFWTWYDHKYYMGSTFEVWIGKQFTEPTNITGGVSDSPITDISWSPDSQRLFLFTEHGLWAAEQPEFQPVQVVDGSYTWLWNGENPQWVN